MTIWTTTADAANTSSLPIRKTRATTITFSAQGLKPLSRFTFWCNGVDMTWACRTDGTRMGAGIASDQSGRVNVLFMTELNTQSTDFTVNDQFHSMQLRDINGATVAISVSTQKQIGK